MHFLNVYPKRMWATLNAAGAFEGQFTFNLAQYGLLLEDTVCDITIFEDPVMQGQWRIHVAPLFAIEMPHFEQFVKTLNHYVFEVLQFTPSRSAVGSDLPMVKLFFDEIYFDMSGAEPKVQKLPAVSPVIIQK
jgi:hypothetical protein